MIKNIKTISMLLFFATTNQETTKIISNNSLSPIETPVYNKPSDGAFDNPLKKITKQTIIIIVKTAESIKRSDKYFSAPSNNKIRLPIPAIPKPRAIVANIFFKDEIIVLFPY